MRRYATTATVKRKIPSPKRASKRCSAPTTRTSSTSNRCSTSASARRATSCSSKASRRRSTRVDRVVGQLSALMRDGYKLSNADVKTASDLVAQDDDGRSARPLPEGQPDAGRQAARRAEDASTSGAISTRSISTTSCSASARPAPARPTWRWRRRSAFLVAKKVEPHHPGAAGGRSGREARVPARRSAGEGQPVPAAALRRALRHARRRARRAAARARHDRGRADRVHARPHAQRRVRHPRRGAEHDVRADEDVNRIAPRRSITAHHATRSSSSTRRRTRRPSR